jgi:GMP synthase-like glutamine amidotransferase
MSVLILKNIASEGPGTIEDFLRDAGMRYRVVEMDREDLPPTSGFDTLVIMGGPMSVNDDGVYPYLRKEDELVKEFLEKGKKVFGVCLGAQVIAKALGARVYRGPGQEIGWHEIELVDGGVGDPLMVRLALHPRTGDFENRFKVFHWHGETFDIPEGAERLAKSGLYENQAFRYGRHVYAFQFHIEARKDMVHEWLKGEPVDIVGIDRETAAVHENYRERALNFYRAFFPDE